MNVTVRVGLYVFFLFFLSGGQLVGRQPFLAACNVLY